METLRDILQAIAGSPLLAILGALVLLTFLLAPLALRAAGLTGQQIVDLLSTTARLFVSMVKQIRQENKANGKE